MYPFATNKKRRERFVTERISRPEVAHVAHLARLDLDEAALDHFTEHLASILDHAAEIEALDLTDVDPMVHPLPLGNVMRDDVRAMALDRDEVLAQAPQSDDGFFVVPAILGAEQ
ncbi:MAG: Asp-tRNA(Asn)/Glu-tRNA(Gln) amidotransferase subunit GatC [Actinomycetia bacterium]|nr:Asp-tRNA(Asn)/Glu-tRNA(Gln) amidotransferase subunit GatC [Actinomycetes bacterium]MCP4959432.1 Asp-tRNA(Asn)/Glu-tRNA(Gln) amidotransferase subunit GatC [Actinomycetes bacterium]